MASITPSKLSVESPFKTFNIDKSSSVEIPPSERFLMKNYKNIAIATDLEPDDVFALYIMSKQIIANYQETGEYPESILFILGEGNTPIKRERMEALLKFFNLPPEIKVSIVEGKSTKDNIFPYDGHELGIGIDGTIPYKENDGQAAVEALSNFLHQSRQPLLIQIKPAHELLQISPDLLQKTTAICYGGFNITKTAGNDNNKKKEILDLFSNHFKAFGLVEGFDLFGREGQVFKDNAWTNNIREKIEKSNDPFMKMFRKFTENWNLHMLQEELKGDIKKALTMPGFADELAIVNGLIVKWDEQTFISFYDAIRAKINQFLDKEIGADKAKYEKLRDDLDFAYKVKPSSGLQFVIADAAVALVLGNNQIFQNNPVIFSVNLERGWIQKSSHPESKAFSWSAVNKEAFSNALLSFIK